MIIKREVEIDVHHSEVDEVMFEAAPFDKLSLILRLARTITPEDIIEIEKYLGRDRVLSAAESLDKLHHSIFRERK